VVAGLSRALVLGLLLSGTLLTDGAGTAVSAPAPADLDATFGSHGVAVVEGPSGPQLHTQAPARMALGPGGEIFVLYGNEPPCAGFSDCAIEWSVERFSADGVRDGDFGAGPGSALTVHGNEYEPAALAVGADGKPVVAALDGGRVVVARFDQQGHVEAMLGAADPNPLFGGAYTPPVVAVQGDGKVVVAVGDAEGLRVIRYLPGGERDPGFGEGGEAKMTLGTRNRPAGLLLGPSGTISLAAPQCCGGSPPYGEGIALARLTADGHPDPSLAGSGQALLATPGAQGNVEAAAMAPGGGVYIAFEVNGGSSATVGNVVKLGPDGSVDPTFGKSGFSRIPMTVHALAVDGSGRLVAGGWSGSAAIFRMKPGGGPDRTFDGGSEAKLAATGPAGGIALQSKGRIVALTEPCCGTTKSFALFRLAGGSDRNRCLGHRATIVGTRGRDELVGTPHRDVIAALGGADEVRALGGDDVICGGKGRDTLLGGAGRDTVRP
jgi:uncharacterized delta-60 repeat protein